MEEKCQVYLLGEFLLDVGQRKLKHQGASVHLTNLPFRVLVHLIEHCDRLVTREELLDKFWEGKDVYEDTLRKAVGAIRKALDDRQEQPQFIETRYGEGYRYIGPLAEQGVIAGREAEPDKVPLVVTSLSSPPSPAPLPRHHARLAAIFGLAAGVVILLAIASAFYRNNNRGTPSAEPIPLAGRPAVEESDGRCGAGLFQRRRHREPDSRTVKGGQSARRRARFGLRLQGPGS